MGLFRGLPEAPSYAFQFGLRTPYFPQFRCDFESHVQLLVEC